MQPQEGTKVLLEYLMEGGRERGGEGRERGGEREGREGSGEGEIEVVDRQGKMEGEREEGPGGGGRR